jgi:hypothetical protein
VAQIVAHLPSKCKALSTAKKNRNKKLPCEEDAPLFYTCSEKLSRTCQFKGQKDHFPDADINMYFAFKMVYLSPFTFLP